LRQLQIQQNDCGAFIRARRELFSTIQIVESLFAVAGHDDLVRKLIFVKSREGQLNVSRVVLDDQNFLRAVTCLRISPHWRAGSRQPDLAGNGLRNRPEVGQSAKRYLVPSSAALSPRPPP